MLGCVIFFPSLTYVMNRGVRREQVAPLFRVRGNALGNFFLAPILGWTNLPMVFGLLGPYTTNVTPYCY